MIYFDAAALAALTEIRCTEFDGEDAPCSRAVLALLERWALVETEGTYAKLTPFGWSIVEALDKQPEHELLFIVDGRRIRVLGKFRPERVRERERS